MMRNRASIIGGSTLIGLGVGFILLKFSGLYFVASLFIGIGIGLLIDYLVSRKYVDWFSSPLIEMRDEFPLQHKSYFDISPHLYEHEIQFFRIVLWSIGIQWNQDSVN